MSSQTDGKFNLAQKTREEIKAEREAKKAAKAAAKATKCKNNKTNGINNSINNMTIGNNKTPEMNTNCVKVDNAKEESSKSEKVDNVKNESLKNDNKISKQNVKETVMDIRNEANSKELVREVSKQDVDPDLNVAVTNKTSEDQNEGKSKAELRAERRAKQEAQRAAKQQQLLTKSNVKSETTKQTTKPVETATKYPENKIIAKNTVKENTHEVNLFKHLYRREVPSIEIATVNSRIHPAIVKLGVQYANRIIVGSNARCIALLSAIKQMIEDFEKPEQTDFIRSFDVVLQESMTYLHQCRPQAVSMQNALRHILWQLTQFSRSWSDSKMKDKLQNIIDTYIKEEIELAGQAISLTIQTKISNGNVILTYGYSSLIYRILVDAHAAGKQFRVIVVDGRPWLEGKELLRRLVKHGLDCSYILINALSFIMPQVSKVFFGAHAIMANGAVMSRTGTAQVALIAKAFNVPVLVACESYKSCERVQTDSIVYNELGNEDELVSQFNRDSKKSVLSNWRTKKSLNLLNIMYDITPADLITAVVTEFAILPCTSVPVILRIKPNEI